MPSETVKSFADPAVSPAGGRRPGRPTQRILTVESIVDRTLEIAGREGFSAVTMNRLAREMGVTPRALYNHVTNRQDIIDRVWVKMIAEIELPDLDPGNWRESIHELWSSLRAQFGRHPRVLLMELDEQITPEGGSPLRIAATEKTLTFFTEIGLSLKEATIVREMMISDLFSFVLTSDFNYVSPAGHRGPDIFQPVPETWLDSHPDVEAPLSRRALGESVSSPDELFNHMVDARIAYVETLLAK
ncbi:TetR/AcrR family transcriptional regulator [Corynebacterium pacaense]|uniref:TetR/AcrR family transcriptional regulator n=1 Tax=Corynebacterium pacaense TaxID=1816684 RepID=UPI0009BBC670|nr:TetR/AcrR family transcriptional regulator [Corynebacterium pacaense]